MNEAVTRAIETPVKGPRMNVRQRIAAKYETSAWARLAGIAFAVVAVNGPVVGIFQVVEEPGPWIGVPLLLWLFAGALFFTWVVAPPPP